MGSANPKSSDNEVVDLSNNSDWQLRLLEARARRAEALKEANSQSAPTKKKVTPWEEQDKVLPPLVQEEAEEPREMDFHDRVNRFKRISRIQPPRERTPEEIALIEAKLSGKYVPPAPAKPSKNAALPDLDIESALAEDAIVKKPAAKVKKPAAAKTKAKKPETSKLGVPADQPEEVFQKTVASVPAEEAGRKPIERATTRIIWFSEPEEEKIRTVVAKTVADDKEERRQPEASRKARPAELAEAVSEKVETVDDVSRVRVATGLGAIGSMLLAAATFIIPVGK